LWELQLFNLLFTPQNYFFSLFPLFFREHDVRVIKFYINKILHLEDKRVRFYSQSNNLNEFQKQALIGLLLGDVSAECNKNTRLKFDQSANIHYNYLMHLYELFKNFVNTEPKITNRKADKRTGKIYNSVIFKTLSLPCFNEYYNLYYVNGKKSVPANLNELLTPIGLAYRL